MSDYNRRRVVILAVVCALIGAGMLLVDVTAGDLPADTLVRGSRGTEVMVRLTGVGSLAFAVVLVIWLVADAKARRDRER